MSERDGPFGTAADELIELDADAASLAFRLMAHSSAATGEQFRSLYESEQAAHEITRERLRRAHDHIALIQQRIAWVMGDDVDPFGDPYDLGP